VRLVGVRVDEAMGMGQQTCPPSMSVYCFLSSIDCWVKAEQVFNSSDKLTKASSLSRGLGVFVDEVGIDYQRIMLSMFYLVIRQGNSYCSHTATVCRVLCLT